MKNGTYRISLEIDLTGMDDKEDALRHIVQLLKDMEDEDKLPDMELTLIEEFEDDDETESEGDLLDEMYTG